jgi:hypothetical protein
MTPETINCDYIPKRLYSIPEAARYLSRTVCVDKVTQYQNMMREKLEWEQMEVTGTGLGTGNAFEGDNSSFSDPKALK